MKIILSTTVALAVLAIFISSAPAATLTESPANIAQGGSVTATWSAIATPTNRDWIALASPGAVDTTYIDWIYVSCTKSAEAAFVNGACPFPIPSSLPNGTYELRLFTNNGYTRLATSNPFTVSPQPPPSTRFVDNGDGTITDDHTGLMWEKKTGSVGNPIPCYFLQDCPDPHDVNNVYTWSSQQTPADGSLFTNFLTRINTALSTSVHGVIVADVCFAGHCDWRIPNIAELRTIFASPCPGGGQACIIDPIFEPASSYWSSTTTAGNPNYAWGGDLFDGVVFVGPKYSPAYARAVRGAR